MYSGRLEAEYGNGHGSVVCQWLIENGEYLGSGEHPEPSEWMIETLAEHLYNVVVAGISDEPLANNERGEVRRDVQKILDGSPTIAGVTERAAVLSLYRILRSLGKW
jgi:hypothetical protein